MLLGAISSELRLRLRHADDTDATIARRPRARRRGLRAGRGRRAHLGPRARAACARRRSRSTASNAGTLLRLLAGILAGQEGTVRARPATTSLARGRWSGSRSRLTRDGRHSSRRRGRLPAHDRDRGAPLQADLAIALPVASAQVKSARAARGAATRRTARRSSRSRRQLRDHTERLLTRCGRPACAQARRAQRLGDAGRAARARFELDIPGTSRRRRRSSSRRRCSPAPS